jgi:hypothetical protein
LRGAFLRLDEKSGAAALDVEAEPIAADENDRLALGSHGEVFSLDGSDEAGVQHVERGGEENGRKEAEDGLERGWVPWRRWRCMRLSGI